MIFSSVNRDFFIRVLLGGRPYFLPVRDFEGATYALSILCVHIPKVHVLGMSLDEACLRVADPANASLLYALATVAGVYLVVHWMYRRHWFLKL